VSAYEFIMSSLPALSVREKPPLDEEEFFARLSAAVGEKELAELRSATISPSLDEAAALDCVNQWYGWVRSLRIFLARARASKLSVTDGLPPGTLAEEVGLSELVKQIMNCENPLEAEDMIDEAGFDYLDNLSASHFFDKTSLFLYRLKLSLALRRHSRVAETGKNGFQKAYEEVLSGFDRNNSNNGENT
jgi:hypothetical protein